MANYNFLVAKLQLFGGFLALLQLFNYNFSIFWLYFCIFAPELENKFNLKKQKYDFRQRK